LTDDESLALEASLCVELASGGVGSLPMLLHVCANSASGLFFASNYKHTHTHIYFVLHGDGKINTNTPRNQAVNA